MDDELTPEEKFAAEDAETMVPRALMEGRSREDIVAELVRLDWTPAAAHALVTRVADDLRRFHESPESRQQLVREARKQVVTGLLIILLGIGVTAFTFLAAMAGALPVIVVAIGLFSVGLVLVGRGWTRWQLYRERPSPSQSPGQQRNEPPGPGVTPR
jgi:hypothetical protein